MNLSCTLCGSTQWPNPDSSCPLCRDDAQREEEEAGCPHCGSSADPVFSRVEPMGYFCTDCGKDIDPE
jgi:hypothetical protein